MEAVVEAQAQAGEFSAALETAKRILEAENQLDEVEDKNYLMALRNVAEQQAVSGHLQEVIETTLQIDNTGQQAELLKDIAESCADAGYAEESKIAITAACEIFREVKDGEYQLYWLPAVGELQARVGEFTATIKTLYEITNEQERTELLGAIAAGL